MRARASRRNRCGSGDSVFRMASSISSAASPPRHCSTSAARACSSGSADRVLDDPDQQRAGERAPGPDGHRAPVHLRDPAAEPHQRLGGVQRLHPGPALAGGAEFRGERGHLGAERRGGAIIVVREPFGTHQDHRRRDSAAVLAAGVRGRPRHRSDLCHQFVASARGAPGAARRRRARAQATPAPRPAPPPPRTARSTCRRRRCDRRLAMSYSPERKSPASTVTGRVATSATTSASRAPASAPRVGPAR